MPGFGIRHVRRMSCKPVISGRQQCRASPGSKYGQPGCFAPAHRSPTQLRLKRAVLKRTPLSTLPSRTISRDVELWCFGAGQTLLPCSSAMCGATMKFPLANIGTRALSAQPVDSCRDLVERAEVLALAEIDEPLQISALCAALSVSERTLRKAFHKVRGLPPCRHLRMLRLSQARRALMDTDCGASTVTEIATGFGFLELGRFSVEYRRAFGESPS
ncbi:unnamed protein product, partial [Phaeothamnion confervicola]